MVKYRVLIKPSAVKELVNIARKKDRQRIVEQISGLADDPRPHGSQKLSGNDRFRLRQGSYRVIYSIEDDALVVYFIKIGYRKDVYRGDW